MAYVYRHIRLDTNEPFYIGIAKKQGRFTSFKREFLRAYNKETRNTYWNSIVKKVPYEVEIIVDDISWEDACKKEVEFILLYGRHDLNAGPLANMTNGGEGAHGINQSQYHRNQTRFFSKGINNVTSKKVINVKSGQIYQSMREAAMSININYNTLSHYLAGHRPNKTDFEFLYSYEENEKLINAVGSSRVIQRTAISISISDNLATIKYDDGTESLLLI